MSLSNLLSRAHELLSSRFSAEDGSRASPVVLFFSLCDGETRSRVVRGAGAGFEQAWRDGVARCGREVQRSKLSVRWLRIDRVLETQATTWGELAARLAVTKRNYFRLGLALDPDLRAAFLEQELAANAMLYLGADKAQAGLNQKNFIVHAQRRFGREVALDFSLQSPVYLFTHDGLFLSEDPALATLPEGGKPVWLPGPGSTGIRWRDPKALNAGRRQIEALNQEQVYALIDSGANFLARQVKETGQFIYGHFPCFGREIPTYNSLRHASTVYSMLEAWELTRNDALLTAIRRALAYLTDTLIRRYPRKSGPTLAYNVDVNGEIKLGANAVSLLALVKYDELTGDSQYRGLMDQLALGIARMQDVDTGSFLHVLNAEDLSLKEAFRIVYYDGEAAFGLMRLYGLTADPRWRAVVERAFDHFIRADHWKHHDHWLSYCANELTLHNPEEKYFRFGVQNIAGYLDFILTRETTYPTLLELSMAFEAMLRRIDGEYPEMRCVLDGLDIDKFRRALHHRAHYLLNGFFWPELAMYFAKPSSIMGSFFIRHHTFRVRIDDIEHYLSGYVAYWKMLAGKCKETSGRPASRAFPDTVPADERLGKHCAFPPAQRPFVANWNGGMLAAAVKGRWVKTPRPAWRATGICLSIGSCQPGNVVISRVEGMTRPIGVSVSAWGSLPFEPQAVIVEETGIETAINAYAGPVLVVHDMREALLSLGRYSRHRYTGTVVGITGSAGKTTTCAMLAHMLNPWGEVGATRFSANTSRGIAWNLASLSWSNRFLVLEMAIAGMERSSLMTRPQVAVVTNIGPAHLQYHHSTENIARIKSKIFKGMEPGGYAVINADALHAELIIQAAVDRDLRVVTYGERATAVFRLVSYDDETGVAAMEAGCHVFEFSGSSRHMASNALACLAVAHSLGLDITHAARQLTMFRPLRGRGARFSIVDRGRRICLIDESYNANPLSMAAALKDFRRISQPDTGILLLGDMLELDEHTGQLHRQLIPLILAARPRMIMLVGKAMEEVASLLTRHQAAVYWFDSVAEAWDKIKSTVLHDEVLMVKGSNSTGLYALVRKLEGLYSAQGSVEQGGLPPVSAS